MRLRAAIANASDCDSFLWLKDTQCRSRCRKGGLCPTPSTRGPLVTAFDLCLTKSQTLCTCWESVVVLLLLSISLVPGLMFSYAGRPSVGTAFGVWVIFESRCTILRFRGGSRGGKDFGSFGATVPENGFSKVGAAHGPRHSLCYFPCRFAHPVVQLDWLQWPFHWQYHWLFF